MSAIVERLCVNVRLKRNMRRTYQICTCSDADGLQHTFCDLADARHLAHGKILYEIMYSLASVGQRILSWVVASHERALIMSATMEHPEYDPPFGLFMSEAILASMRLQAIPALAVNPVASNISARSRCGNILPVQDGEK